MPDLTTIALMIALSSGSSAISVILTGRTHWREGSLLMAMTMTCYGLSYVCISFMASPNPTQWFMAAYAVFACGQSCWLATIYRFYQIRPPWWLLLCLPLWALLLFTLAINQPELRVRLVSGLFLCSEIWGLLVLARRRSEPLNKGSVVLVVGVLMFCSAMLLRVFLPNASLTLRDPASSSTHLLLSFTILFIAMHLKSTGFLLLCSGRQHNRLQYMANMDVLTELPNRRALMQSLKIMCGQAQLYQTPFSLLMIDVDHFKRVNDACGHQEGDRVLTQIAHLLQTHVRPHDIVGRYGGEEFVIACPNTDTLNASLLADRMCHAVRSAVAAHHAQETWPVTISVGLHVCYPAEAQTLDHALLCADQALYQAKTNGRNRVWQQDSTRASPAATASVDA